MSMGIDFTKPLTDEERDFLLVRGRYADIEKADNAHGTSTDLGEGDGTGTVQQPVLTSERAAQRREELLRELAEIDAFEASDDEDEDDEDEVPPYESWKSGDLNAEIDRRNEGRDDATKISKAGSVQDRANRLYADDANQA
jgi:hypothetical protein